jgi:hypothetical protein
MDLKPPLATVVQTGLAAVAIYLQPCLPFVGPPQAGHVVGIARSITHGRASQE